MDEQQIRSDFLASLDQYNQNLTRRLQPFAANASDALFNFSTLAGFHGNGSVPGNATAPESVASWWVQSLQWTQGVLTTLGLVGNFLVILTLIRRRYQSKFASAVFVHQTFMDFMVCVFTLILLVKPPQNPTGNTALGFILCHVISSQLLYWYFVFSSVQNLVLIAIDRYFAVFKPIKYKTLGYGSVAAHLLGLHAYSLAVNIIDVFSVEFDGSANVCSTEITNQAFKKAFKVYGFIWFFLVYLIPVAAVVCLYVVIIYRLGNRGLQTSRIRQRAATELTKSAVIITGIFIVCFSYDCIYYLLGHLDLVQYVYNSPTQLIGVALVTLNSCSNPLVYCITMQSFRSRMMSAVLCCCPRPCGPRGPAAAVDGEEASAEDEAAGTQNFETRNGGAVPLASRKPRTKTNGTASGRQQLR